jgi:hypothetical protein
MRLEFTHSLQTIATDQSIAKTAQKQKKAEAFFASAFFS